MLHKADRAVNTLVQTRDVGGLPVALTTRRIINCIALAVALAQRLRLQLECSQRGAQLVGGVGHEVALRFKSRVQAAEQGVDLVDQRKHLDRQAGVQQR